MNQIPASKIPPILITYHNLLPFDERIKPIIKRVLLSEKAVLLTLKYLEKLVQQESIHYPTEIGLNSLKNQQIHWLKEELNSDIDELKTPPDGSDSLALIKYSFKTILEEKESEKQNLLAQKVTTLTTPNEAFSRIKLMVTPMTSLKCGSHGEITQLNLLATDPETARKPANCVFTFGYSPTGKERIILREKTGANFIFVPLSKLTSPLRQDGYFFVDVDGDEANPCRPVTIRERMPEFLWRKLCPCRCLK